MHVCVCVCTCVCVFHKGISGLAHLSHRLICELIVYPSAGFCLSGVVAHNIKHLLQNRLSNRSQILCGVPLGRDKEALSQHLRHIAKMAATLIYSNNPSKIYFSRTKEWITTKLGIQDRGLKSIIYCSNNDPW